MKRKIFDGSHSSCSGGVNDIPLPEDDDFDMSDFKVKKQKMKRLDHELVPQRTEIPTVVLALVVALGPVAIMVMTFRWV